MAVDRKSLWIIVIAVLILWATASTIFAGFAWTSAQAANTKLETMDNRVDIVETQTDANRSKVTKLIGAQTDSISVIDSIIANQQAMLKLIRQR